MTSTIEHYAGCDARATRCAVENIRDMANDPAMAAEVEAIPALTPAEFCDYLLELGAGYQRDGIMGCSCAADRLKAANDRLRLVRKQYRAGRASGHDVGAAMADRDAIKAAQ